MSNQKIINRIKKLMALAGSPVKAEAQSALLKARELMEKYDLSIVDITVSTDIIKNKKWTPNNYEVLMVRNICSAFGCDFYWRATEGFVIIGSDIYAELAKYTYQVLNRQLQAARKDFLATVHKKCKRYTKIKRADSFCVGWVMSVSVLIKSMIGAKSVDKSITNYMEGRELSKSNARSRSMHSDSCMNGLITGRDVQLNNPITNTKMKQLS